MMRRRVPSFMIGCLLAGVTLVFFWARPAGCDELADQAATLFQTLKQEYTERYLSHQYPEALETAERSLEFAKQAYGEASGQVAQVYNDAGTLCYLTENFARAVTYHEQALALRDAQEPPEDAEIVQSLRNLAKAYVALERYEEAEPLYARALSLVEANTGPASPKTKEILDPYAAVLRKLGKRTDAAVLESRSKVIEEILKATP